MKATSGRPRSSGWVVLDGERPKDVIAGRRVQRGDVTTLAAVTARTSRAPSRFNASAHSFNVAPVVLTSSTRTTTLPAIRLTTTSASTAQMPR